MIGMGTGADAPASLARGDFIEKSSRRKKSSARVFEIRMHAAAFQPKWRSMKGVSQFHLPATITTGGAAKCVRVPPIEM